jgi:uncharacterized protein (TIGR03083 family)
MALDHLAAITTDAGLFAAAIRRGPLDAPVLACPGWDLRELTLHQGHVHRWSRLAAATGARPGRGAVPGPPERDDDPAELAAWLLDGAAELVATLAQVDPEAPTWHPFPVPLVAGLWPRRQAQETMLHRWDAERAVGATSPLAPAAAADGIDEYFTVMVPRLLMRDGPALPDGHLHLECRDVPAGWGVRAIDGEVFVTSGCAGDAELPADDAAGRARVDGDAAAILLALWGRGPTAALAVRGDAAVAEQWFGLGGV